MKKFPTVMRSDGATIICLPPIPQPRKKIRAALDQAKAIHGEAFVVFGKRELADCLNYRHTYAKDMA